MFLLALMTQAHLINTYIKYAYDTLLLVDYIKISSNWNIQKDLSILLLFLNLLLRELSLYSPAWSWTYSSSASVSQVVCLQSHPYASLKSTLNEEQTALSYFPTSQGCLCSKYLLAFPLSSAFFYGPSSCLYMICSCRYCLLIYSTGGKYYLYTSFFQLGYYYYYYHYYYYYYYC